MTLEPSALTPHEAPRSPAPDAIPDLPIWPSGVARFADGILEITTGEGIRVAAPDLLRIGIDPPRAGRLQLTVEYRVGLDRCKTSRWVEACHEQALHRLVETVAAATGTMAAASTAPRRRLTYGARASCLAVLAVGGALAAAASTPPDASAATERYASPTGTGTDCSSAKPCTITQAISSAGSGEEIIVSPGDYVLTTTVDVPNPVTIHGIAGRPRPRLLFKGAGQSGMRLFQGALLRRVEIVQDEPSYPALVSNGAKADQVVLRKNAGSQCAAVTVNNSTIRNSVVVASGSGATAICARATVGMTSASWYRNITAVATGSNGVAIEAYAAGQGSQAFAELVNVIAKGGTNGAGLAMQTDGSIGAKARITAVHTNYANYWHAPPAATFIDGGGNQGSAPTFVNAAAGDYRQAPGSVTIGAGADNDANGALDVDGDPRRIGATDIGADEFVVAPSATTGAAGAVTDRSASLSGSVDAKGAPTTYHFQYGTTTAYGGTTPTTDGASGNGVAVGAALGGLLPATTYHYRLVAANAGGLTKGADRSFTTLPAATASQPFTGVELVSRKLTYVRRSIAVRLRCAAATVGSCSGRTKLTALRRSSARRVTLGRVRFSIAAGAQARVRVRVSRAGRRLLGSARRLRGRAVNATRDAAGRSKTTRAVVTIRRRHR